MHKWTHAIETHSVQWSTVVHYLIGHMVSDKTFPLNIYHFLSNLSNRISIHKHSQTALSCCDYFNKYLDGSTYDFPTL